MDKLFAGIIGHKELAITTKKSNSPKAVHKGLNADFGVTIIFDDKGYPIGARYWTSSKDFYCPFCGCFSCDVVHPDGGVMIEHDVKDIVNCVEFEWKDYRDFKPWWYLTDDAAKFVDDWVKEKFVDFVKQNEEKRIAK